MLRKDIRKPSGQATADPAEIARFEALAEEWWKPNGAFKVVHAFNAVRVAHLTARLPALVGHAPGDMPLKGKRLLDVGCGAGIVTVPLSRLGADCLGIDAAEKNVQVAARHAAKTGANVEYRHALPEDLAGEPPFDIVLSLEVIEHVADVRQFLRALAPLVASGGVLVIGTLNRTLASYAKAIVGAEYVLGWLPRGTHDWRKFVKPVEIERGLQPYGFAVLEVAGVSMNPLTMKWGISRDHGVNYLQFLRKL
ncbi:MAG: bifunctional 2-polyprenyl-6-hydroxyphenol methylase/3-demethylubiquinol 3-O-methyltransferase UbiG [Hyphomicrobiales bacterium]|nr:bifunctional 2-polyprenyl-6-hydroxyphenol methylase/3-demethylubiquinol 3-O-methyltransferase UbiG [Hyphomicrobiales bacterium]